MTLAELRHEYRPYDTLPAFDEGFRDYQSGLFLRNPYDGCPRKGVEAQDWDPGAECASDARNDRRQRAFLGPAEAALGAGFGSLLPGAFHFGPLGSFLADFCFGEEI
jgi:hypothetical protein